MECQAGGEHDRRLVLALLPLDVRVPAPVSSHADEARRSKALDLADAAAEADIPVEAMADPSGRAEVLSLTRHRQASEETWLRAVEFRREMCRHLLLARDCQWSPTYPGHYPPSPPSPERLERLRRHVQADPIWRRDD